MKNFINLCKAKLFNTKLNTFLFFLFLAVMIYGITLCFTMTFLGGGDIIVPIIMMLPFIVNIIGSFSNTP
jgi:hypothetical protein